MEVRDLSLNLRLQRRTRRGPNAGLLQLRPIQITADDGRTEQSPDMAAKELKEIDDLARIFLDDVPMIDVRAPVEFAEIDNVDKGTRILMTEQIAILDGSETSEDRRQGWGEVFDRIEREV